MILKKKTVDQPYINADSDSYSCFPGASACVFRLLAACNEQAESARKEPGGAPGEKQTGRIKRGGGKACRKKIKAKAMPSPGRP